MNTDTQTIDTPMDWDARITSKHRYFAKDCRVIDRETGAVIRTNHPSDFGLEATPYRMRKAKQVTCNDVKFWNR